MYVVGLTGGIGSGKSTVAARLAELGAEVVDADRIAREIVEPGQPALAEIRARFGDEVIAEDGTLDRSALASIVFADEDARADLNGITHPRIGQRVQDRVAAALRREREGGDGAVVVLDVPLLVESDIFSDYQALIVVEAPEDVRVDRVVRERDLTPEDARARVSAQADDTERRRAASYVVDNGGDLDDLYRQVDDLYAELRAAARAERSA